MSVNFVVIDDATIRAEMLSNFETATGETLNEGNAKRIYLENFNVPLVATLNAINTAGRNNLIEYAKGDYLDAIGARWGELGARIQAQKAFATVQFTLSAVQAIDITIPSGTRVTTADNSLFFAVTEDLIIAIGDTTGTVMVEALATGASYNGLTTGLINKIVDPVPYVLSASNTTTSQGGADIEPDEDYRARLILVASAPSTAGSIEGYKFWTLKADSTIASVNVASPTAGAVVVTALLENGTVPDSAMLTKIEETLELRRPLTDSLTVQAPTAVDYAINFTYYISLSNSTQATAIQAAVTTAVSAYIAWQRAELGRDVNPDELRKLVLNAGASRMTVTTPIVASVAADKYANNTTLSVTYGGVE